MLIIFNTFCVPMKKSRYANAPQCYTYIACRAKIHYKVLPSAPVHSFYSSGVSTKLCISFHYHIPPPLHLILDSITPVTYGEQYKP